MQETLFIADLHLDPQQAAIFNLALKFFSTRARQAETLYILGDLFEVWLGDDDDESGYQPILTALRELTEHGVSIFIMRGNRDFLLNQQFAQQTGSQLLPDAHVIDLYGVPTLLMHGDTLCTLDIEYQAFQQQVRDSQWQQQFLAQPLAQRRLMAQQARHYSKTKQQTDAIIDVTPAAVIATMAEYQVNQLIHGHVHQPACHKLTIKEHPATRWVLGDWREGGAKILSCQPEKFQLIDFY
jgi:UDP-2,3-diacylglucosamine hydrolase